MEPKRIVIVGAGMAGLCSGIYLQMNGYEVHIYEAHDQPGGLCTSWSRKGYTFDGCIHWLLGSSSGTPLHRVWNELVDLNAVPFVDHDHVLDLEVGVPDARGDTFFHFHADIDRQERALLAAAPEDARIIRKLMSAARRLAAAEFPPVFPPAELRTWRDRLAMARLVPVLPVLHRWGTTTAQSLAAQCRSPFLKAAFERLYGGHDAVMLVYLLQQAWYHKRCAGYPVGGSLAFAERFEERFRALGGTLHYRTPVARILEEDGAAVGIRLADGREVRADVVVSAADGRWTLFEALEGRHLTPQLEALYRGESLPTFPSLVYVSLGLREAPALPCHVTRYRADPPLVLPDGTETDQVPVHVYDYDPTLAPAGGTVLNVMLESRRLDFWRHLRAEDPRAYREAKHAIAEDVVDLLDARIGGVRRALEVVDVATPATFHRYTGNWQGSYEGWLPLGNILSLPRLPRELPTLRGFHMVGQWVEPGGGLPPAALHGRDLARVLCARDGRPFRVVPPPGTAAAQAAAA